MRRAKSLALIAAISSLTGCGNVEWFPPAPLATPTLQTQTTPAGQLRTSTRRGPQAFLVITTRGVFDTYTSLQTAPGADVYLDQFTDSGMPVAKMLRANAAASILVREIISMEGM